MNKFRVWFHVPDQDGLIIPELIIRDTFVLTTYDMDAFTRSLHDKLGLYVDFWFVPWHQIILIEEWEK